MRTVKQSAAVREDEEDGEEAEDDDEEAELGEEDLFHQQVVPAGPLGRGPLSAGWPPHSPPSLPCRATPAPRREAAASCEPLARPPAIPTTVFLSLALLDCDPLLQFLSSFPRCGWDPCRDPPHSTMEVPGTRPVHPAPRSQPRGPPSRLPCAPWPACTPPYLTCPWTKRLAWGDERASREPTWNPTRAAQDTPQPPVCVCPSRHSHPGASGRCGPVHVRWGHGRAPRVAGCTLRGLGAPCE